MALCSQKEIVFIALSVFPTQNLGSKMENAKWCLLGNFGALEMEYVDCIFTNFLVLEVEKVGWCLLANIQHILERISALRTTPCPHISTLSPILRSRMPLEAWKLGR